MGSAIEGDPGPDTPGVPGDWGSLLTVAEVAKQLRVSKMTIYRLIHTGELSAIQIGRSFRVRAGIVEQYLQGATKGATHV